MRRMRCDFLGAINALVENEAEHRQLRWYVLSTEPQLLSEAYTEGSAQVDLLTALRSQGEGGFKAPPRVCTTHVRAPCQGSMSACMLLTFTHLAVARLEWTEHDWHLLLCTPVLFPAPPLCEQHRAYAQAV